MAYDAARGVTVLFGGSPSSSTYLAETWEWDGVAWTQREFSRPFASCTPLDDYDSCVASPSSSGGTGSMRTAETWEWNGWRGASVLVSGPAARARHAMAYDAARGVSVLFGGSPTSSYLITAETWEYGYKPCPADFDHNGFVNADDYDAFAVLFDVADPAADFNGDGFVNGNDYDEFAVAFDEGC